MIGWRPTLGGAESPRSRVTSALVAQASESRRVPTELLEPLDELMLEEPPRLLSSFSMNDERADCAVLVVVDVVPEVVSVEDVPLEPALPELVPEELEVLPVSVLMRFWNAVLRAEVTPLDAFELPSKSFSRVLSAVSFARFASAEALLDKVTVESALLPLFEVALAEDAALDVAAVEAVVAALKRLDRAESELLPTLPIDIITQAGTLDVSFIG